SRPTSPRSSRNTRLAMLSATIGALLILVLSVLLNWPDGSQQGGSPGGLGMSPAPQEFEASPGSCLNWTEPDVVDLSRVHCNKPHLFEATGNTDIGAEFPENASYPGPQQWQRLKRDRCVRVSRDYLNGRLDPSGRFSVGAFTPSKESWQNGDRKL